MDRHFLDLCTCPKVYKVQDTQGQKKSGGCVCVCVCNQADSDKNMLEQSVTF